MSKNYFKRVLRAQVLSIGKHDLHTAFAEVEADWRACLQDSGITLPATHSARWYQLAVLKHFQARAVHKDDISEMIAKCTRKPASDQQVRHLKTQSGWYILNRGDSYLDNGVALYNPNGCHVLITTKIPFPKSILQRRTAINKGVWKEILQQYDHTCASCGTKVGEYHRYDPAYKVETLERGHMNPNKPLARGNIIPQCRWCNRTARGDFVFDAQGRPRAVASVRPVACADAEVRKEIGEWMRKQEQ